MRLANHCLSYASILLLLASACGDDGGSDVPDARPLPDSGGTTPDAPPLGEPDAGGPNDLTDEAFLVFYERILNNEVPNGPAPILHVQASFMEAIAAAPPPELGGCTDVWYATTEAFPTAQDPNRVYLDVGDVTIQGTTADGTELTPWSGTPGPINDTTTPPRDFFGRQHDLGIVFGIGGPPNPGDAVQYMGEGDVLFDVTVSGGEDFPETTWEDELYVPSIPTLTPPTDAPITVTRGEGLEFTYEAGANTQMPEGEFAIPFAGFVVLDGDQDPDTMQFQPLMQTLCTSATGTITIPSEVVDKFLDSGPFAIVRGHLMHRTIWVDEEDHSKGRFDMMGLDCFLNTVAPSDS